MRRCVCMPRADADGTRVPPWRAPDVRRATPAAGSVGTPDARLDSVERQPVVLAPMKFFMFHLMPWPYLPETYVGPAWVKCPNGFYDGRRGHGLYNRYLDELIRAEALGFDGVCVNEHHANAYGNMPSPNLSEAIDLILRCWTEPGPFVHMGKHYQLRYVNPWPTPVQQPHPPIWIPGAGSYETMDFVARRRWAYMGIPYFHKRVFKKNFDYFREACEK